MESLSEAKVIRVPVSTLLGTVGGGRKRNAAGEEMGKRKRFHDGGSIKMSIRANRARAEAKRMENEMRDEGNKGKRQKLTDEMKDEGKKETKQVWRSFKYLTHNLNGLTEMSENDLRATIKRMNLDIVGVMETKLRQEDSKEMELEGYRKFEARRSDLAEDRAGGGVMVLAKDSDDIRFNERKFRLKKVHDFVRNERVWVTARTAGDKIAFCFVYFAQQKDKDDFGEWNNSMYKVIEKERNILKKEGFKVTVAGDFNGWVGNGPKGVPGNDARVNLNGERLLNFLERTGMVHLNGLECCKGMFTRHCKTASTAGVTIRSYGTGLGLLKGILAHHLA